MAIWGDAYGIPVSWRGPTANKYVGSRLGSNGVVIHIAEGTYDGTISWQLNPASEVSSHFIVAKDGRITQMVDTDDTAWTEAAGNRYWWSIENEGGSGDFLTDAQVRSNGAIFARMSVERGIPLQLTSDPNGRGLGHHSMGGVAWGNHPDCPGDPIVSQKLAVLDQANAFLNPPPPAPVDRNEEYEMNGEVKVGTAHTMVAFDNVNSGLAKNGPAWISFFTDPAFINAVGVTQLRLRLALTDGAGWNVPTVTLGNGALNADGTRNPSWRYSYQLATGQNGARIDRLDLQLTPNPNDPNAAPSKDFDPVGQIPVGWCVMYAPKNV